MPGWLSPTHLILLLIVLLVFVGPGKLPESGAALGKAVRGFRDAFEGREGGASATSTPPAASAQAPMPQPPAAPVQVGPPPVQPAAPAPYAQPYQTQATTAAPFQAQPYQAETYAVAPAPLPQDPGTAPRE